MKKCELDIGGDCVTHGDPNPNILNVPVYCDDYVDAMHEELHTALHDPNNPNIPFNCKFCKEED